MFSLNGFLLVLEDSEVSLRYAQARSHQMLGKNPKQFDAFNRAYPLVTLERRKQEIDEIKDDIDRLCLR